MHNPSPVVMAIPKNPQGRPKKPKGSLRSPRNQGPPERVDVVIRSEGQRLLLAVKATLTELQNACGASRQTVIDWRFGRATPNPAGRAALWNAYEIPAPSWGRLPSGMRPDPPLDPPATLPAPAATPAPAAPAAPTNGHAVPAAVVSAPSSLDETAALLGQIRRQLEATDILPSDRVRITDSYTRTLALQHRLQREVDLTEDRIIREHPTWQRIRTELARVLARYPAIADEVCAALDRLGV
jgi:hypothetical protein